MGLKQCIILDWVWDYIRHGLRVGSDTGGVGSTLSAVLGPFLLGGRQIGRVEPAALPERRFQNCFLEQIHVS